jgi:hypothetical protein
MFYFVTNGVFHTSDILNKLCMMNQFFFVIIFITVFGLSSKEVKSRDNWDKITTLILHFHVLWRTINLGRPVIGLTSKCYVQLTPFSIFDILVIVTAIIKIKIGKRSVHQSEIRTVDGQIKLGQKWQSHKSKFTNLHRLITALSQIG